MKRWMLLVILLLAGCAKMPAPPTLSPDYLGGATPYIAPSYPTAAAQSISPTQAANGVNVVVNRAWQDGKQVNADVCFTLPDDSDWSIWSASLKYGDTSLTEFGTTLVSRQSPANGQAGQRCDTIYFYVPPDADLSNVIVTIDSIGAPPQQDDYCSVYMPKIQQALLQRGIGITLNCSTDANGVASMQITDKPPDMTEQQAEDIVYSDEFYTIKGPWVFTFNLK
ncbi:MAG TPA: hypothetical protein VMT73_06080 [Anaerolineales bacterium]|nr:hypothetical protein [Anaerolineales bacterium]